MSTISARLEALAELHHRSYLEMLEWHTERSAIRQHEGGMSRAEADRLAVADIETELEGIRK